MKERDRENLRERGGQREFEIDRDRENLKERGREFERKKG